MELPQHNDLGRARLGQKCTSADLCTGGCWLPFLCYWAWICPLARVPVLQPCDLHRLQTVSDHLPEHACLQCRTGCVFCHVNGYLYFLYVKGRTTKRNKPLIKTKANKQTVKHTFIPYALLRTEDSNIAHFDFLH